VQKSGGGIREQVGNLLVEVSRNLQGFRIPVGRKVTGHRVVRQVNAVRSLAFRDHHPYREADLTRIVTAARDCGAKVVVTTEKDFVRLLPFRPFPLPVVYLPLTMDVEPAAEFGAWLEASLRAARDITVD